VFEIGSSLREARMRQKFELGDVERATRIRARYLMALEEERFDILPGTAYAKGFLRTYADHLGLDAQRFVDEYNSRFAQEEELQAAPAVRVRRRRRWRDLRLAAIPIAVVLALVGWQLSRTRGHHPPPPQAPPATETTAAAERAPTTITRALEPAPTVAKIRLVAARGPCWIDVHLGSRTGRAIYIGTLRSGQPVRFVAQRLWIRMGAPWNLDAQLNGKTVQLARTVGNVLVTGTNLTPAP
jgi:Helix-turn-helix domain/RodZ C-terminal domain